MINKYINCDLWKQDMMTNSILNITAAYRITQDRLTINLNKH